MVAAALPDNFDAACFIESTLPDMDNWIFPYDALTSGISGVVGWLQEDEHLYSPPPPPVPPHRPLVPAEDMKIFHEFFQPQAAAQVPFDTPPGSYETSFEQQQPRETCCSNCGATKTVMWMWNRGGDQECYDCHLYFSQYNQSRPLPLMNIPQENTYPQAASQWVLPPIPGPQALDYTCNFNMTSPIMTSPPITPKEERKPLASLTNSKNKTKEQPICANCGTRDTSMWRWNTRGERECNACNLFEAHNQGKKRPQNLWKNKPVKRRRRNQMSPQNENDSLRFSPY